MMNKPIPANLEFPVKGFRIQEPPASNQDWGYSLIVDLAKPVPFPAVYLDKKNNGMPTPYKSPVTSILVPKSASITKALINQDTGEFNDTFVVKKMISWIEDGGLLFRIVAFNNTEPTKWAPDVLLLPGEANMLTADKVAELMLGGSQPANKVLPKGQDGDELDAEILEEIADLPY
jgi:hypothetical protein